MNDHRAFPAVIDPHRGNPRHLPSSAHIDEWGPRSRLAVALWAAVTVAASVAAGAGVAAGGTEESGAILLLFFAVLTLFAAVPATAAGLHEWRYVRGIWDHVVAASSFRCPQGINDQLTRAEQDGLLERSGAAAELRVDLDGLLEQLADLLAGLADPHERFAVAKAARDLHDARLERAQLMLAGHLTAADDMGQVVASLEGTLAAVQKRANVAAAEEIEARRLRRAAVAEADAASTISTVAVDRLRVAAAGAAAQLTS